MTIYALKIYVDTDKAIQRGICPPKIFQVYAAGIGLMIFGMMMNSLWVILG